MATRVGVVLSGCGVKDGTEITEAVLTLHALERVGARAICMAPNLERRPVVNHLTNTEDAGASPRNVLVEAARIARGQIRDISTVTDTELDALVFPGGIGVTRVLSDYAERGVVCDVHPDVARLLRALLARRRPMGFLCVAPILAARVLGPAAGVRITFGSKSCEEAKHAAIMGADVRPCPLREVVVDEKNRVFSTPAFMYEEARILDVGISVERLVRGLITLARTGGRRPAVNTPARTLKIPPQKPSAGPAPSVQIRKPAGRGAGAATRPGGGSS